MATQEVPTWLKHDYWHGCSLREILVSLPPAFHQVIKTLRPVYGSYEDQISGVTDWAPISRKSRIPISFLGQLPGECVGQPNLLAMVVKGWGAQTIRGERYVLYSYNREIVSVSEEFDGSFHVPASEDEISIKGRVVIFCGVLYQEANNLLEQDPQKAFRVLSMDTAAHCLFSNKGERDPSVVERMKPLLYPFYYGNGNGKEPNFVSLTASAQRGV